MRRRTAAALAAAGAGLALGAGWLKRGQVVRDAAPLEPPFEPQRWDDDAGTWRFAPPPDRFSPDALLDLRSMNEAVAGETGFVRADGQGGFARGDGRPLRFWAVNSDVGRRPHEKRPLWPEAAPDLARHARFLAKRGVNLVRLHRQIAPDLERTPKAALDDIDERERDGIWRTVAAMKREGIYTALSPYWAAWMKFAAHWGIGGGAQQPAWGLLFFDPQLRAAYKTWLAKLLVPPNPYTGVPLALEPALALLQLQNEDSLLFWTAGAIQGAQREALEAQFAAFAVRKHGSIEKARGAWQGERDARDGDARVALLDWWLMTQPASALKPGRAARVADQTEFLARTMHGFNEEIVEHLRGQVGARTLINAGNWRTASAERLNDAERWSYGPGEVDAVNRYNTGVHQGPNEAWAVAAGDRYTSPSALLDPGLLPTAVRRSGGRPIVVSEGTWVMPHAWAVEGPLLVAAHAARAGVAGYMWFATESEGYAPPMSANGFLASQAKWSFATPELLGQFPAAALIYRRGDMPTAPVAVEESRPLAALWQRESPALAERDGFDPNRDAGAGPRVGQAAEGAASSRGFLAGPVVVRFEAGRAEVKLADAARQRAAGREFRLDDTLGLLRIDTPRAQAVVGRLAHAGPQRLGDVEIASRDAFAAVAVVSLDGQPLVQAGRVLVQVATPARPEGWAERATTLAPGEAQRRIDARLIESHGAAPWRVRRSNVVLRLFDSRLREAVVLDANGEPLATRLLERDAADGSIRIELPSDAMHLLLRR
ncbi:MAG TPA: hypothetical protein VFR90_14135 [Methylibium sp.]|uniref:hypothetical protein n=1 Tax=Methylibium sp. TaxID=2067992 RepID=UPI002DBF641B|nr:hypothetical protein [Methylibium sp.]HEU4460255.1 hypothetical protein [Methylibium sp.]